MLGPIGGFHVEPMARAVYDHGYEVIVGGPVWADVRDSHIRHHPIPVSVRTWPTARWLRRLLRETQPDVVHAHWMPTAATRAALRCQPARRIGLGFGCVSGEPASEARLAVRRTPRRHADGLLGCSRTGARGSRRAGRSHGAAQLGRRPRGVLSAHRQPGRGPPSSRPAAGADDPEPAIGRRCLQHRDHRPCLRPGGRRAQRCHAGAPARRSREDDGLGALRHPERVRTVGRVPHEQMADYYRAADVCVSIASSDSSPRSVWEAMACGAPCVLSDLPWVHELIKDEEHALVVLIDDEAVAEAMRRLLDDRPLASRIRVDARRLVEEHRDSGGETERLCAIYEQVAREGGHRSRLPRALGPAAGAAGTAQAVVRRALAWRGHRGDDGPRVIRTARLASRLGGRPLDPMLRGRRSGSVASWTRRCQHRRGTPAIWPVLHAVCVPCLVRSEYACGACAIGRSSLGWAAASRSRKASRYARRGASGWTSRSPSTSTRRWTVRRSHVRATRAHRAIRDAPHH